MAMVVVVGRNCTVWGRPYMHFSGPREERLLGRGTSLLGMSPQRYGVREQVLHLRVLVPSACLHDRYWIARHTTAWSTRMTNGVVL
jgi:hypothetical protein